MRSFIKVGKYIAITALALVVLGFGGLLGVRTYLQHANAPAFAIDSPNGINESAYVKIGGIDQWLQIRGQDRNNPVLLCVHGGPGGTWDKVTRLFLRWEKDFTVVLWDQRGAGKSLRASGASIAATMSVDRMAQDGVEVADYLRTHLQQDKVILLGHSWGSILGINMVKRRPDLFHAYVGTGQVSDLPRSTAMVYARLVEQARAANDAPTLQALTRIGAPPFTHPQAVTVFFQSIEKFQPASDVTAMNELKRSLTSPPPGRSLLDDYYDFQGFAVVPPWRLYTEMLNTRLAVLGPDIAVPIFIFHGAEDPVTPASLAQEYFQALRAPRKEFVLLAGGGHFAVWSMADTFRQELVGRVRPIAKQP